MRFGQATDEPTFCFHKACDVQHFHTRGTESDDAEFRRTKNLKSERLNTIFKRLSHFQNAAGGGQITFFSEVVHDSPGGCNRPTRPCSYESVGQVCSTLPVVELVGEVGMILGIGEQYGGSTLCRKAIFVEIGTDRSYARYREVEVRYIHAQLLGNAVVDQFMEDLSNSLQQVRSGKVDSSATFEATY